jgi:hypothetical protein
MAKGGLLIMSPRLLRTPDGIEIEIPHDMFEDFYVLSTVYGIPVKSIIKHFLDGIIEPISIRVTKK